MTTLRRETILKIKSVLIQEAVFCSVGLEDTEPYVSQYYDLAVKIADALTEPRKLKLSVENAIALGLSVTEDMLEVDEQEALKAFERDLQLPANWHWYGKGSEDKAMKVLREFVVKQYGLNHKAFEEYQTWRTQPYARGAMSNLAIKRNPENFPVSWSDYEASRILHRAKTPLKPVKTDENNIPMSY